MGGSGLVEEEEGRNDETRMTRFDALGLPFRQAQGPERIEGLKALSLSKGNDDPEAGASGWVGRSWERGEEGRNDETIARSRERWFRGSGAARKSVLRLVCRF